MGQPDFRIRSRKRDFDTDSSRIGNVLAVLDEQILRINHEEAGLRSRLDQTTNDAAFSQVALENGENVSVAELDELTDTITRCAERIAFLEVQVVFLARLRQDLLRFMADRGLDAHGGGPNRIGH